MSNYFYLNSFTVSGHVSRVKEQFDPNFLNWQTKEQCEMPIELNCLSHSHNVTHKPIEN